MKKGLSLLMMGMILCSFNIASQNLIKGGDMEAASQAYWSEYGLSSFSADGSGPIWGDTEHDSYTNTVPGFGTGGVLTVDESWGHALYFIAQPVTLTANTTYKVSLDYSIGDFNKGWYQVFIGTTDPSTVTTYTDNQIGDLLPWVTDYSQPGRDNYFFKENFTPPTSGTYYFVVQWGCGDNDGEGYITMFIDNVSLVANSPTGPLIQGGDMEASSEQYWDQYGLDTFSADHNIVWGDTGHDTYPNTTPGFGTDGVLTVREGWGKAQFFIAQPVELTANTTYKASFDYSIGDFNKAWYQVFIGTTDPSTVTTYTDNQIGDLLPWVTDYSQPGRDNYFFKENFTPPTSGTYYFVIQWGCGDSDGEGYFTMFADNVSLVANPTGIKDVNINNAVVVGGKSFLSAKFEGMANVAVYSLQGQLIKQATAQNAFRADNLPAGIYLVKVNNKTFKVVVR